MNKHILNLAFLAALPTTVGTAYAQDGDKREIVVTARSLNETGNALKDCLARKCPPDEDIKATLAHAENQFVEGDYKDARTTILRSLGRNRKFKKAHPVAVSDLLRANSNVAVHLGEADSYRLSILDLRDTLKEAFPANSARVMSAELEVADSRLKLGYPDEARRKYLEVEKDALAGNMPFMAAKARLRYLSLLVLIANAGQQKDRIKKARVELDRYVAEPTKGAEKFAFVAEVLRSRLDRKSGDNSSTEALIKAYAELGSVGRPVLLQANPIERKGTLAIRDTGGSDLYRIGAPNVDNRWVDIGFWINSEGRVEEPEILRSEGKTNWVKPVLKSIRSRRYTPTLKTATDSNPGFYAVERYSLTAKWEKGGTGSRMRKRSANYSIERIDLSVAQ